MSQRMSYFVGIMSRKTANKSDLVQALGISRRSSCRERRRLSAFLSRDFETLESSHVCRVDHVVDGGTATENEQAIAGT